MEIKCKYFSLRVIYLHYLCRSKIISIKRTRKMEISGKIIAVLPIATGQGKNGTWRSQDYVLETADQYPKKVCFNLFNDKIDQFPLAIDDVITASFDVESREYNGRWYTTIRAWKVEKGAVTASAAAPASAAPFDGTPATAEGSDLPF